MDEKITLGFWGSITCGPLWHTRPGSNMVVLKNDMLLVYYYRLVHNRVGLHAGITNFDKWKANGARLWCTEDSGLKLIRNFNLLWSFLLLFWPVLVEVWILAL